MGPGSWVLRKNLLSFPKTMTILEFYKNKIYFNQLLPGHWSTLFSIWIRRQIILPIFWKTKSMAVIVNPLLLTMAPQTNWTSLIFVNFMLITILWHLIYHHPPDRDLSHWSSWSSLTFFRRGFSRAAQIIGVTSPSFTVALGTYL